MADGVTPLDPNVQFIRISSGQTDTLLSALKAGSVIEAKVQSVITEGLFLISFMDNFVEAESDLPLKPGQTVSLTVKSKSPVLTLQLTATAPEGATPSQPAQAPQIPTPESIAQSAKGSPEEILSRLGAKPTPENIKAATVMVENNLPQTKDVLQFMARAVGTDSPASTADAAAFVAAKGLSLSVELAQKIAATLDRPLSLANDLNALRVSVEKLAEKYPVFKQVAAELAILEKGSLVLSANASPDAVKAAVESALSPGLARLMAKIESSVLEIIKSNPVLMAIDKAIELAENAKPQAAAARQDIDALIKQMTSGDPKELARALDQIKNLDGKALVEFKAKALEAERGAISRMPELSAARDAMSVLKDVTDAVASIKTLNAVSQSFGDNSIYAQIPFVADGRQSTMIIKISQRQKNRSKHGGQPYTGITINIELSKLGLVLSTVELLTPRQAKDSRRAIVSFKVSNKAAKKVFEENSALLTDELSALGYKPAVSVTMRRKGDSAMDLSEELRDARILDVKA